MTDRPLEGPPVGNEGTIWCSGCRAYVRLPHDGSLCAREGATPAASQAPAFEARVEALVAAVREPASGLRGNEWFSDDQGAACPACAGDTKARHIFEPCARAALLAHLSAVVEELKAAREAWQRSMARQKESFERTRPLCSGHVGKVAGGGCLACAVEVAESALAALRKEIESKR